MIIVSYEPCDARPAVSQQWSHHKT